MAMVLTNVCGVWVTSFLTTMDYANIFLDEIFQRCVTPKIRSGTKNDAVRDCRGFELNYILLSVYIFIIFNVISFR